MWKESLATFLKSYCSVRLEEMKKKQQQQKLSQNSFGA
jgi:hypothetical protein